MAKLLEQALEALRNLPPERQAELAEVITMAAEEGSGHCSRAQLDAIDEGIADAGRFASDTDVKALFAKFRSA
jgi:hypothetical protein